MKKFLCAVAIVFLVIIVYLGNRAILENIEETDFHQKVSAYMAETEEPIVESAMSWSRSSFDKASNHERFRLRDRADYLAGGGGVEFAAGNHDAWWKVHRDVMKTVVGNARHRFEKTTGADGSRVELAELARFLPEGWEKRIELQELHFDLRNSKESHGRSLAEWKAEFAAHRAKMDQLMDELNIKKREKK